MIGLGFQIGKTLFNNESLVTNGITSKTTEPQSLFAKIFQTMLSNTGSNNKAMKTNPKSQDNIIPLSNQKFQDRIIAMANQKDEIPVFTVEKCENTKAGLIIDKLKKHFLSQGESLDSMHVDEKLLSEVQNILDGAGFDEKQLNSLLNGLKENAGSKGVKLSDLFTGLADLANKKTLAMDIPMMQVSAVPHIESILSDFGLNSDKINEVLNNAKIEGKGLDINKLTNKLKKIINEMPDKGRSFPDNQAQQQIINMMSDLGLANGNETFMTLERFTNKLENLNKEINGNNLQVNLDNLISLEKFHPVQSSLKDKIASKHQVLMTLKKLLTDSGFDKKKVDNLINDLEFNNSNSDSVISDTLISLPQIQPLGSDKDKTANQEKIADIEKNIESVMFTGETTPDTLLNQDKEKNIFYKIIKKVLIDAGFDREKTEKFTDDLEKETPENYQMISEILSSLFKVQRDDLKKDDLSKLNPGTDFLVKTAQDKVDINLNNIQNNMNKGLQSNIKSNTEKKEIEKGQLTIEGFINKLEAIIEKNISKQAASENKPQSNNDLLSKISQAQKVQSNLDQPDLKNHNIQNNGHKITDSKVTDNKITDSKVTDSKVTDNKITDSKVTDSKVTDSKVTTLKTDAIISHNQKNISEPAFNHLQESNDSKIDNKIIQNNDHKITDNKITDNKVTDNKVTDNKITDNKITTLKTDAIISHNQKNISEPAFNNLKEIHNNDFKSENPANFELNLLKTEDVKLSEETPALQQVDKKSPILRQFDNKGFVLSKAEVKTVNKEILNKYLKAQSTQFNMNKQIYDSSNNGLQNVILNSDIKLNETNKIDKEITGKKGSQKIEITDRTFEGKITTNIKIVDESKNTDASRFSKPREIYQHTEKAVKNEKKSQNNLIFENQLKSTSSNERLINTANSNFTPKTLPSYLLDQVSKQILKSIERNDSEINLSLKPAELGRLKMNIINDSDGIKINIVTENQSTKDALVAHIDELKNTLMDQGFRIEKVDVQISFNFDQATAQFGQDSSKSGNSKGRWKRLKADDNIELSNDDVQPNIRNENGSLNLVA